MSNLRMRPSILKLVDNAIAREASSPTTVREDPITNHQRNARKAEPDHVRIEQTAKNAASNPNEQGEETT